MASSRSRDSIYMLYGIFLHHNSTTVCLNPKPLLEYCALILPSERVSHIEPLNPALVAMAGTQILME